MIVVMITVPIIVNTMILIMTIKTPLQALLGSMLDAEKAIDRHEMDKKNLQVSQ